MQKLAFLTEHVRSLHASQIAQLSAPELACVLDDLNEHIAVLVDSPPEPVFPAGDADNYFIQMPNVSRAWRLMAEAPGILRSELLTPAPDRLIGDDDATLEQHLLDEPEAQRKPEVQPNSMGDDLGRKAVALVADGLGHAAAIRPQAADQELP